MNKCECVCGKCKPTLSDRLLARSGSLWARGWPFREDGDLMGEAYKEIERLKYELKWALRDASKINVQSPPTSNLDL